MPATSSWLVSPMKRRSAISKASRQPRTPRAGAALAAAGDERTAEYELIRRAHNLVQDGNSEKVNWVRIAETHLYRRKRAANLADTCRAIDVFERTGLDDNPLALGELLSTGDGCRAVRIVLRRIKQQAIAENVMEIITCGAVAPYQQVLGGKLVAMLMTSPQVVADVRRRYRGRVSLIASGMAGRAMVRTPELSLLTTSSLYAFGSAQYNRIRIPGDVGGAERSGYIRYRRVGSTESFGHGAVRVGHDRDVDCGSSTRQPQASPSQQSLRGRDVTQAALVAAWPQRAWLGA